MVPESLPSNDGVEYRHVPGFPGYAVGDDGSVWSCRGRGAARGRFVLPWRALRQREASVGSYRVVSLGGVKPQRPKLVHRLIAAAFHGCPSDGQEVRHLDGNPRNNVPSNLAWGTAKENAADRDGHGRTARGERNSNAMLTEADVAKAKAMRSAGAAYEDIANELRVSLSCAHSVVTGKAWKHLAVAGQTFVRNVAYKLDAERVRGVRLMRQAGQTQRAIARAFGVTQRTIVDILHGITWGNVS